MEKTGILESWKEISDHLGHSIKTCQRWEKEFGLPVHRFDESARGRVYADKAELNIWKKEKLQLATASEKGLPLFRSLAVLPIRNLCGDKEKDYLSDGITETLITELGQISAFRVISHQSVKQFQGKQNTIPEIAKILRVEALVEGALLQAKDTARLSINLVGAFPERHVWAQTFECGESEVAWLQRRIAHILAEQAGVELMPEVKARLSSSQTVNPEAYEAYLRGKAAVWKSFLKADIERALGYFEKAVKIDPTFAPAYAEKGWAYSQLGFYSHLSPGEAFTKLKESAQKAIELDPSLAEGYALLGFATSVYDWEWPQAEQYFKRALELNPNSSRTHFHYAQYLNWVGKNEEALEKQRRLIELDPLNPESHWNLGWCFFWAGQYDESMAVFKKLQELAPEDHWLEMALGVTYSMKNMPEQALEMCEKARAGVPLGVDGQFDCFTAIIFAKGGETEKAKNILDQLKKISKERTVDFASIAGVYVALGDIEAAITLLEKSFREHSPTLVYLKVAPFWKPLYADPRCQCILRRLNFPSV